MKFRPIIARFISYKKRNEFIFAKAKLKNSELFPGVYLKKDLTPLRKRLVNYVKAKCNDQSVMHHTINGKIRMKHSAAKAGKPLGDGGRDEGLGNWLAISSPEHLFKYNIDVDFDALGQGWATPGMRAKLGMRARSRKRVNEKAAAEVSLTNI